MLVTVVIPAYNAEALLPETLESVLAQTYRELEVLVVDDGSTDRTARVAQGTGDRRVRTITKPNGGHSSARNVGYREATGVYVAFLDADDLWDANMVERHVEVMTNAPGLVATGSKMRFLAAATGRTVGVSGESATGRQDDIKRGLFKPFPIGTVLFRADVVASAGGFDEELPHAEDLDFMARVARLGPIGTIDEVLGAYRVHASSVTAVAHREQRMLTRFVQARLTARDAGEAEPTLEEFRRTYRPSASERRRDRGAVAFRAAGLAAVNGQVGAAVLQFGIAASTRPMYTARRLALRVKG